MPDSATIGILGLNSGSNACSHFSTPTGFDTRFVVIIIAKTRFMRPSMLFFLPLASSANGTTNTEIFVFITGFIFPRDTTQSLTADCCLFNIDCSLFNNDSRDRAFSRIRAPWAFANRRLVEHCCNSPAFPLYHFEIAWPLGFSVLVVYLKRYGQKSASASTIMYLLLPEHMPVKQYLQSYRPRLVDVRHRRQNALTAPKTPTHPAPPSWHRFGLVTT